ncbi:MAG: T9SS type A sorting domain-containing protein [Candidatus Cloacimonetes bacterium]|nr:T9SS type A sorting domain-containing protein [Candidatus Cloacimonadota bacterium]
MASTFVYNNDGSNAALGDLTFEATIDNPAAAGVVLTENSGGCGFVDYLGYARLDVQCATFGAWTAGNNVTIVVTHTNGSTGQEIIMLTNDPQDWGTGIYLSAVGPTNPDPAENPTPVDEATDVAIDTNLTWQHSGTLVPDGYKLYFGTDGAGTTAPTTLANGTDLGDVLTYDPASDLAYSTTYYWQIVPYTTDGDRTVSKGRATRTKNTENSRGDATGCPIWEFTTEAEPVIPNAWINEIHYDNDGGDVGEAVEVVIEGTYDLTLFQVELYNGNGGGSYGTHTLDTFTAGDIHGDFTIYHKLISGIQNGDPDGLALSYDGTLIPGQFLSYEGTFTATDGVANGISSTDIGVSEPASTPIGESLQLAGSGTLYSSFTWQAPATETFGALNNSQVIGTGPAPLILNNVSREYTVPTAAQTCDVQCDITGGTAPYTAVIKYGVNGTDQTDIPMANTTGDTYVGTIPAQTDGDRVEYYIQVTDSGTRAEEVSSTYGLFWGVSPISNGAGNIKAVDTDESLLYEGYYCTVTGVATVASGIFSGSNLEVYVQDTNGGINIFKGGDATTTITEGNSYTITGPIDFYNGKSEIVPDDPSTDIVDNGAATPVEPMIITIAQLLAAPEDYENTLIGIQHVTKDAGTWGYNANLDISDGTGSMVLRVDGDTDLDDNTEPTWPKDVVGIFSQYDSSSPYDEGYQILPRSIADIHDDGTLVTPNLATLVAPADGGVVPLGDLVLDWDYTGPAVTGYEVYLGYTGAAAWVADVTATEHTINLAEYNTYYDWYVIPYIETGSTAGRNGMKLNSQSNRGLRSRIYPDGTPDTWSFSTFDQGPPPAPPIPPAGGTTNINGGTTGNGGSGAGSSVTVTPTPGGTPPSDPITVQQVTPDITGVPFPDNALDIAFVIETVGTITDPITIRIEWDYPVPTIPTSGDPELVVNHGSGWVAHPVDDWDFSAPSYWIEFTTAELSDWVIGDGDESTLPVTLTEFTGICYEGIPHINWTTQSETENLGWNVYRSDIETGWEEEDVNLCNVDMIPGQGTTSSVTNYTYQDVYDLVEDETYYYWLESISISGDIEIFGPVSVLVEIEEEPNIIPDLPDATMLNSNYPNPFNPTTTIKFDIKEGESGRLTIFNILGQKVLDREFTAGFHTYNWNAAKQASGVYFYTLKTASYYETKKMILMK